MGEERATRREFILYWVGAFLVVLSAASILMTISGLIVDVLQRGCWYPVISPLLGVTETKLPYYCPSPVAAIVRFTFSLLAELLFVGLGAWMMLNGRRR